MATMMTSLTLVVLLVGNPCVSAGTKKCKWDKGSTKCDMDDNSLATIMPADGGSKVGNYLAFAAESAACSKLSATKAACEGDTNCVWDNHGKCHHKEQWNMMSLIYDTTGCGSQYTAVNCQFYTKAGCEGAGAPCEWTPNDGYVADAAPDWQYHDDFGGCLQISSSAGSCDPNGAQLLCGNDFNTSKLSEDVYPLWSIMPACQSSADADAFKTCAANYNACPNLVTDTMAALVMKDDKTVSDEISLATAMNACIGTKTCQALADAYLAIPLEADLPDDSCEGHTTAEACGAQGNCFWATADTHCMKVKDIRESPPPAACIMTKIGKIEKRYFDSDADMIAHYNEQRVNQKHCSDLAKDDTCDADAKCSLGSHTSLSCSGEGTIETGEAQKNCDFDDEDDAVDKARNDLMWGEGAVDGIMAIGETCKAFTTETECTGAEMTAAEESTIKAALVVSTADSARPTMTSCPIALGLVGALAWAVSG